LSLLLVVLDIAGNFYQAIIVVAAAKLCLNFSYALISDSLVAEDYC
jgi:hypothetical protein